MPFINLTDLEMREPFPGFKGYFVHSDNMTFAYWTIKSDSSLAGHSHEPEQVVNVTEGKFELTIEGQKGGRWFQNDLKNRFYFILKMLYILGTLKVQ